MSKFWLLATAPLLLASPSFAEGTPIMIGNFTMTVEKNPFAGGNNAFADMEVGLNGMGLRCLDNELSVAISRNDAKWTPGDRFEIKFRADNGEIFEREGAALDYRSLQIMDSAPLIDQLSGATSASFQVNTAVTTYTFSLAMRESAKAVAVIKKACGEYMPHAMDAPVLEPTPRAVTGNAAPVSNHSCDSFNAVKALLPDATNGAFEAQKLSLKVTDVRLIGISPPPDSDSCLIEVETNIGMTVKLKYRLGEDGKVTVGTP
jgi:hypothetical protein